MFGWKEHWFGPKRGRERGKGSSTNQADADDLVRRWNLGRKEE